MLPGAHVAEFPEADRLRFLAGADGGQEFLFEEKHGDLRACSHALRENTRCRRSAAKGTSRFG
jgi:hypothetical protein